MALATLAIGLVLGLAIGPGLGNAGSLLPLVSPPLAQFPPDPLVDDDSDGATALPTLAAPAGSDPGTGSGELTAPTTVASVPIAPPASPAPLPAEPPPVVPPPVAPAPTPPTPPPTPSDPGFPISGTVLAASVNGKSFSVADSEGNLLTVFSDAPPDVGEGISTTVLPLANGTFSEYGGRRSLKDRSRATARGMISYADPELGVIVLSGRGTSIPLDGSAVLPDPAAEQDPGAELPDLEGQWVEVKLAVRDPEASEAEASAEPEAEAAAPPPEEMPAFALAIRSLESLDETAEAIELTGKVTGVDPGARTLVISADSLGLLKVSFEIAVPERFDLGSVVAGRVYSATARRTAGGTLRLSGFSAGFSSRAADRPGAIFGEQAY